MKYLISFFVSELQDVKRSRSYCLAEEKGREWKGTRKRRRNGGKEAVIQKLCQVSAC